MRLERSSLGSIMTRSSYLIELMIDLRHRLTVIPDRRPQIGRARDPLVETVQDLAARANHLDGAVAQHEDRIDLIEDAGPVADDDDHGAIPLYRGDRLVQG